MVSWLQLGPNDIAGVLHPYLIAFYSVRTFKDSSGTSPHCGYKPPNHHSTFRYHPYHWWPPRRLKCLVDDHTLGGISTSPDQLVLVITHRYTLTNEAGLPDWPFPRSSTIPFFARFKEKAGGEINTSSYQSCTWCQKDDCGTRRERTICVPYALLRTLSARLFANSSPRCASMQP